MEEAQRHFFIACAICGSLFMVLCAVSATFLSLVNWRPWRLYSYVVIQKWPAWIKDHERLSILSGVISLVAWFMVVSPVLALIAWGVNLMLLLEHTTIGLAVIMPGTALLLSFYAMMLWWRTRWQSSRVVAVLLLVAVSLLSAYEISTVYITSGRSASRHYSTSGFFFGISAITLAINMLFICKLVYDGEGLDLDEYVRRLYKYANTECVEIGPAINLLPETEISKDSLMQKRSKVFHPVIMYLGSVAVLLLYSVLYALLATPKPRWLAGVTAAAVILFDVNVGACMFGFEILKNKTAGLFIAGSYRIFLICFGAHYWFLGHSIGYAVVASVLIGAAVTKHFAASDSMSENKIFLENARVRLREGFRRKGPGSCSSFSEGGHGSSTKRSSSILAGGTSRAPSLRHAIGTEENTEVLNSAITLDSGRPSIVLRSSSCTSIVQEADGGLISSGRYEEKLGSDTKKMIPSGPIHALDMPCLDSASISLRREGVVVGQGEQELTTLFEGKGLDPNFAVMYEETGINPPLLELLQRTSMDADRDGQDNDELRDGPPTSSTPAEISLTARRLLVFTKQLQRIHFIVKLFVGTPERAWMLLSLIFISELLVVTLLHSKSLALFSSTHEQLAFGVSALLVPPVVCSNFAYALSVTSENPSRRSRSCKWGLLAWLLSTLSGVLLSFLSKSSVLLGCSITGPSIVACLYVLIPIWISNGYRFYVVAPDELLTSNSSNQQGCLGSKDGMRMTGCILGLMTCIIGLGITISLRPWDHVGYHGWSDDPTVATSPYTSSIYLGWAIASAVALLITGILPAVSWFATYRFSLSSAVCVGMFVVILVAFCGGSYLGVVQSREGQIPIKADFLAALLPLVCIPALFVLCCGLYKWKDEGWQLSRGVCIFLGTGLLLLIGAIAAIITTINPWMVGVAFLLFLLLSTLAISVIHYWALHNFYLTWTEMILVGLAVLVLAFASFLVGLLSEKPFVGASVGFFSFLLILAGRALSALLSSPVVLYSPRVLPVYVYDAHADCAKNRSGAFIALYGVAVASIVWGVVASLEIYPPYAGVTVSALTLVVAFGFAVSRPTSTMKMVEEAVQFLSKETVIQAISRSASKTRNALSGAYSAPQRSASSTALLVGDPKLGRDKAGNYVLPREDIESLYERLQNQELAARMWRVKRKARFAYHHEMSSEAQANARIFLLEEALDTEWVYMWDKFGGYLLLLLCLAAKAERVQDEVRLRLFLDSKGFSNLSSMKTKKWRPEDYKEFELMQESFIREKEMEDELILQRREEEGRGKERRKLLLERGEQRRREVEAAVLSSMAYVGSKEAAAVTAAAHAVACDVLFDEVKALEQVLSIAQRILSRQKAERAQQTGVSGAVCIIDNEPRNEGGLYGVIESSVCGSSCITFSAAIYVEVGSGPVCLLGTETCNEACLEVFIAGSDDAFEGGQIGVRVIMKGEQQTTVCSGWNLGSLNLADGRWHNVAVTIDIRIGEARSFLDGMPDEPVDGLSLPFPDGIWREGTEVWIGAKPPMDLNAFGRSDSERNEARLQIMDVFVWGRCLTAEEIEAVHNVSRIDELLAEESYEEDWEYDEPPSRGGSPSNEVTNLDDFVREEDFSDEHFPSGRKRKAEKEVTIEIDYISRMQRRPKLETPEDILQRMQAVELAVREDLAARGEVHFTDQEFPPTNQSLFIDPDEPSQKIQVVKEWMCPRELVKARCRDFDPCLFAGTADASDVCQGRLGNCWFLSAVAVLTEAKRISEVIITRRYNEEGIYTVRFCIQGEWVPVVIDDWIPCEYGGKPAFASSRKGNEIWVSILEKAYAKLHGSYEALEGGVVQDALVDLTGGAGEEIDMRSAQAQIDIASGRLWSQLLRFKQEGFLLGAGSPSGSDSSVSSSGIVQGHAYSLLQVREVDGHKLVQIRNPWANEVEWNGPWSDSSAEWTVRMKHKLKYLPQALDGVFWMSWQDFQLHFCSIYVCRVYPPEMQYSIPGKWLGSTAGGCQHYCTWHQNPQYLLKAVGPDSRYPINVFVTLAQGAHFVSKRRSAFHNYQSSGDATKFYIGMRILQTQGHRAKYNIYMHESVGGTDYVNSREISFEMVLEPDPKGYTIVPSTLYPGEEAPFVLSVYTKASVILEAI